MGSTLLGISALLIAVFGINTGFGLQASLLGVRADLEGFHVTVIGAIMAMYYFGYIGGSLYAPRLVNRVGHIRTFAALASVASAVVLSHAVFVIPGAWLVLRALTGFCLAGMVIVTESWLNQSATNANRGSVLSIYMVVSLSATGIGQLLLNAAPPEGAALFMLVSALVSLGLVPVAVSTRPSPTLVRSGRMGLKKLFFISPMGVVGCLATGLLHGAFWGMGAVFAQGSGLDTKGISLFMAAAVAGGILSQWPVGKLSDRIDRRLVLFGLSGAIVAAGLALTFAAKLEPWWLYVLAGFYGMAALPLYSISNAHVNDLIDPSDFVPASSALLILYGIGAAIGPFAAGGAMAALGVAGLFYYSVAVSAALGGYAAYRLATGQAILPEDKTDFREVPSTTAVAHEMAAQAAQESAESSETKAES